MILLARGVMLGLICITLILGQSRQADAHQPSFSQLEVWIGLDATLITVQIPITALFHATPNVLPPPDHNTDFCYHSAVRHFADRAKCANQSAPSYSGWARSFAVCDYCHPRVGRQLGTQYCSTTIAGRAGDGCKFVPE